MRESLVGKRILISGGYSLLGRYLVPKLISCGAHVSAVGTVMSHHSFIENYDVILFLNNPEFIPDELI